jgi:hypothetical protein
MFFVLNFGFEETKYLGIGGIAFAFIWATI